MDLEILAIVARVQYRYKRLCLSLNNSDVCRPKPNYSGISVHNIYLGNATESNAKGSIGLWRDVPPDNVKFNRNDRFHANHIRLVQQCPAAISANQTTKRGISTARCRCIPVCATCRPPASNTAYCRAYAWARKFDSRRLSRFLGHLAP